MRIDLKKIKVYERKAEGNPAGVKAALSILEIIENNLRLPLVTVSKQTHQKLEKLIRIIKA